MTQSSAARSTMSIGEVLAALRPDFPDVTISKIRFLESEGLVQPARAPSGYRQFSSADLERLRYVLAAQRDHYLPLRVIKEHLGAMDRGLDPPPLTGVRPRVPPLRLGAAGDPDPDSFRSDGLTLRLTRAELVEEAGIDEALVEQLAEYGLVRARPGAAPYDEDDLVVARTAGRLAAFGVQPRHLRAFKVAADREVGLVDQLVGPLRRGARPEAQARAEEVAREVAALSVGLHAALVRSGLRHSQR